MLQTDGSRWTVPCWACGEEMQPGLSWHRDHDARGPLERAIDADLGIDSAARDRAMQGEPPASCLLCRRPAVLAPLRVAVRHVELCLCPEHTERLMRDFGSWLADWIGGDSVLLGQMLQGPPPAPPVR